jgi:hypothetical protein
MISDTDPEPLCDVVAQLAALRDPAHSKGAVWLAKGTPVPPIADDLIVVRHEAGVLITNDPGKAERFSAHPSDEMLAELLDYPEAKVRLAEPVVVVQAFSQDDGAVIYETGVSLAKVPQAVDTARRYGVVRAISLEMALSRRMALRQMEGLNAPDADTRAAV